LYFIKDKISLFCFSAMLPMQPAHVVAAGSDGCGGSAKGESKLLVKQSTC